MADTLSQERRQFFRLHFNTPLQFKSYSAKEKTAGTTQPVLRGNTQNISQSGVLFRTGERPPQLSSIVWMDLDIRTLKICQEIEERALIFNNGLLGKVVRVEEDEKQSDTYDVGVCFLTQDQKNSREVQQILTELSQTR